MADQDEASQDARELRGRAEEIWRQRPVGAPGIPPEEAARLVHELEVHQIELEMQNEELRRSQEELELARARYFDLFDLAPVGYLTLNAKGTILEANLTAANLLGTDRSRLIRKPVTRFIFRDDQDVYYLLRKRLYDTQQPQGCELRMVRGGRGLASIPQIPLSSLNGSPEAEGGTTAGLYPADGETGRELSQQAPEGGSSPVSGAGSQGLKVGEPFWVRLQASVAVGSSGVPMCRVALSDITERKRAEEERAAAQKAIQRQSERLQILHRIERAILEAQTPGEIAQIAVQSLRQATGAVRVTVALFDWQAETMELLAQAGPRSAAEGAALPSLPAQPRWPLKGYWVEREYTPGQVRIIEHLNALPDSYPGKQNALDAGVLSEIVAPMSAGGIVIGCLSLGRNESGPFPPDFLTLAQQVAVSLAIAIHNARLHEQVRAHQNQLRRLSRRLVDPQERERRYVADQLYNEAGQVLAALKIHLGHAHDEAPTAAHLAETQVLLDRVMRDLHDLATNLRPATLDRLGLASAIRQYAEEWGREHALAVQIETSNLERIRVLREDVETAVYRVVQEALMNVAQHAQATTVDVCISKVDGEVRVALEDNGVGFDTAPEKHRGSMGLLGMQERAEALGGRLAVESGPGKGTVVIVAIPIAVGA